MGMGSLAPIALESRPRCEWVPKVWCADRMGSSPLSSGMPWTHRVAWEQVRVIQGWRRAWSRAVGWGRGRRKGGQGSQWLPATFYPCSTARNTRGIESAELGTRNAYKYPQSFSAGGKGQCGAGHSGGLGTAWGWALRPRWAAPRCRGGCAMVPRQGKGQSEGSGLALLHLAPVPPSAGSTWHCWNHQHARPHSIPLCCTFTPPV